MASKAPIPQEDFSLDDIKLDDFPMEDNALFADLDNEMRADGGQGKAGGDALDLNLDFDVKDEGSGMPALEEPGELKLDDTLDLDLSLDDAPQADAAGGGDLDLNLDEPAKSGGGDDLDIDLNLDLDEAPKADGGGGGDLDLNFDLDEAPQADGGADLDLDLKLDEAPSADTGGGGDLDLDLNLDLEESGQSAGGDLDLDVGTIDLNLDEPAVPTADDLSLDEPGAPSLAMEEPGEPKFSLDLPEEPGLSLDVSDEPSPGEPAAPELEGMSLSLAEPELPATPAEPEIPALPAMPEPEPELSLDDGFSLETLPAAEPSQGEPEAAMDFLAAPDINLDDVDLSLDTTGFEEATSLEPLGAQVDLQPSEHAAPTMEEGFDLPPLAETKGDTDAGPTEPFEAMPDVKLSEDELLELNLPHTEAAAGEPEFTMEPEPLPPPGGRGMPGGEFRLTEPLAMEAAGSLGGPGMALGEPMARAAAPALRMAGGPSAQRRTLAGGVSSTGEAAVSQDILLSIPHKISVQMGSVSLVGKDIRGLAYGSVVQLNRTVGEPVDLLLDGRSIAQGEIVLINGKNLGVRILALNK
jgi:flagellar motor switch/type III secretory pathway protein FliN